jgi:wyosine [tRNA(Phe)-imidazoG37] synthetase (radical SAM superfamily)
MNIVYGPVPSWRVGRSLGVDPLGGEGKRCTYDCTYCQLGPTRGATRQRGIWVQPADLAAERRAEPNLGVEYVTFAGMGEPTIAEGILLS